MWFDSHCHLHLCDEAGGPTDVIGRARAAGVSAMVTLGTDVATSRRALEIASADGVYAGVGMHPTDLEGWSPTALATIDGLLGDRRAVAVGETGLDFHHNGGRGGRQEEAFAAHIDLAKKHDKPLVIHTRDSVGEAIELLGGEGSPRRLVFHCWSGHEAHLRAALEMDAHISFAGNVSFSSAGDLRRLAALVPGERLLVETDSPFLTPVPNRGKPNEPRNVAHVGQAVADARGVSAHLLGELTTRNASAFFGVSAPTSP